MNNFKIANLGNQKPQKLNTCRVWGSFFPNIWSKCDIDTRIPHISKNSNKIRVFVINLIRLTFLIFTEITKLNLIPLRKLLKKTERVWCLISISSCSQRQRLEIFQSRNNSEESHHYASAEKLKAWNDVIGTTKSNNYYNIVLSYNNFNNFIIHK